MYYANKYSNTFQSLTRGLLDLRQRRRLYSWVIHPPSIFTYGLFLRRGRSGSCLRTWFSLYHTLGASSPRDFASVYYINKYSNTFQSREIIVLNLGLRLGIIHARVYVYIHRPSLPTVHSYGGGGRGRVYGLGSLFIFLWISHYLPLDLSSPRDFASVYYINKYSNTFQSLAWSFRLGIKTWDYTRAGLYIHPPSIFTYGLFLRRGRPGSCLRTCSSLYTIWVSHLREISRQCIT